MAEKPVQDKTEAATPRKLEEARDKGNVAKSMELNSVAVLIAGILSLVFISGKLIESISQFMISLYQNISFTSITQGSVQFQAKAIIGFLGPVMAPIFLLIMFAGIGINVAQVGILFSKKALIPKFSKINPKTGFKRLLSFRSTVELVKGVFKIVIVASVALYVLRKHLPEFWILSNSPVNMIFVFFGSVLLDLVTKICLVLFFLAVADFAYQKWDYNKNQKMTKQEVKDEQKQHEGSPEIKGRIRSLQKQLARKRMMAAIPDATVVVTNPIFIAIAMKYEPEKKSDAPKVVAKGKRKIAEKIKEIAIRNNIPIVENKSLAKSLFDTTEIGMEIPVIFYQAVAEVLAQIYKMNRKRFSLTAGYSSV